MDHIYHQSQLRNWVGRRKEENGHSSSFSLDFSRESAGFPKSVFHTVVWMNCNIPRILVSLLEFFSLQTRSSRTLCPTRYPISFNLKYSRSATLEDREYRRSNSAIPSTLFWAYATISAKRKVYAECESSKPRERFRLRSYIDCFRGEERIV